MEYIIVKYPKERQRLVYIDGEKSGLLNRLIQVDAGIHRFSMGDPQDYVPAAVEVLVKGTSALHPAIVEFVEFDEDEN